MSSIIILSLSHKFPSHPFCLSQAYGCSDRYTHLSLSTLYQLLLWLSWILYFHMTRLGCEVGIVLPVKPIQVGWMSGSKLCWVMEGSQARPPDWGPCKTLWHHCMVHWDSQQCPVWQRQEWHQVYDVMIRPHGWTTVLDRLLFFCYLLPFIPFTSSPCSWFRLSFVTHVHWLILYYCDSP